jgi:hypothetical protein
MIRELVKPRFYGVSVRGLLRSNCAAAKLRGDIESPSPAVVAGRILELIDALPKEEGALVLEYLAEVFEEGPPR